MAETKMVPLAHDSLLSLVEEPEDAMWACEYGLILLDSRFTVGIYLDRSLTNVGGRKVAGGVAMART